MTGIAHDLSGLRLGEAIEYETMKVHPLIRERLLNKDYLTLDEALQQGLVRVTEVSEGGSVPHLLLSNRGDRAVFLLDGEELVGAKQNRVLNISILAPAEQDIILPVSCVEAGRWRHTSREFRSAPRAQFAAARARKCVDVSANLVMQMRAHSDQRAVWQDIDDKLEQMQSASSTRAMEQAFEDNENKLARFVERLRCVDGQVGAVFSIRGRPVGMELFDHVDTCRLLMDKIVRSYALDAIDPGYRPPDALFVSPEGVLDRVSSAGITAHPAIGEGEDLRFDHTPGIVGGALFARDRVVHLCAFVTGERRDAGNGRGYGRSASMRRRFRNAA